MFTGLSGRVEWEGKGGGSVARQGGAVGGWYCRRIDRDRPRGKCVWDGIAQSSVVVTYTLWSVEWTLQTFQWTQVGVLG